jgi:hopanoid biosynthesis associated protein HpnK
MTARMIINADDFGLCEGVNKAVAEAHNNGVLTSATIMANMPGLDEAVEMAKKTPRLGVGVHLNLTEGRPISSDRQVEALVGDGGEFKYSAYTLAAKYFFDRRLCKAIEIELAAQIEVVIGKGIKPTHLDSHKHFHCFGPIYKIVCSLAERFGIGAVRWPWEPATVCYGDWPRVGFGDRMRVFLLRQMTLNCQKIDSRLASLRGRSGFIKNDIFFGVAHTGRIDDKFWDEIAKTQFTGVAEVMTHPGYTEGLARTRLVKERQVELKWLCEPTTKQLLSEAGIELVHYGQIDGK